MNEIIFNIRELSLLK